MIKLELTDIAIQQTAQTPADNEGPKCPGETERQHGENSPYEADE